MLSTSPKGRAYIESKEGLCLTAYYDVVGVLTIGYGDTANVRPGMTITREEADQRLTDRLARDFEPAVRAGVGSAPTTQGQFDAMVSLAYNIGTGGFRKSTVLKQHVAGNYKEAGDAFLNWSNAGGRFLAALAKRRDKERKMYMADLPGAQPAPEPAPAPEPVDLKVNTARTFAPVEDLEEGTKAVQSRLIALGFKVGADGDFGPQTCGAVLAALG